MKKEIYSIFTIILFLTTILWIGGCALNWGMCYEKAGELCGTKGYEVLEKSGDTGAMVTAGQFGLFGGSVINRSMIIK